MLLEFVTGSSALPARGVAAIPLSYPHHMMVVLSLRRHCCLFTSLEHPVFPPSFSPPVMAMLSLRGISARPRHMLPGFDN